MLGDKYRLERERQKKLQIENLLREFESAPKDHDWVNTPLFAQSCKGATQIASLTQAQFAKQILWNIKIRKLELQQRKEALENGSATDL